MLYELLAPHEIKVTDEHRAMVDAGELVGNGKPPEDWIERRREEKKPTKIAAPWPKDQAPTPHMAPRDSEAEAHFQDFIAKQPDGWGINPIEMLPLTGSDIGVPARGR